jgi:hypothetical protein
VISNAVTLSPLRSAVSLRDMRLSSVAAPCRRHASAGTYPEGQTCADGNVAPKSTIRNMRTEHVVCADPPLPESGT